MLYRKILLSFVFTFVCSLIYAQESGTISGTVKENEEEITGATVLIKSTKIGTVTNHKGHYEIIDVKPGNYTIMVSYMGYITESRSITLNPGQKLRLNFLMNRDLKQLDNVAIAGKTESRKAKESGFAVNSIELKQYANTTNDLNQILNRSSGVKVREQGGLGSDFEFSINGLSGGHIKYFIDGIPMESYGSGMTLNNIPVNLAERVEVYKGVVPAYLGSDALGGAVNIITKRNKGKSIDASYSIGSFNTHRAALAGSFTDKKTGITTNINSYYNFSDNNYFMYNNPTANVKLRIPNETNDDYINIDKARRFHDGFESLMAQAEVGVADKKWADIFVAGITYTSNFKERQTGANQERVIGAITNKGYNIIPSIRFRKENLLIEGLSASIFANFSQNKDIVTDTSGMTYSWDGRALARNGATSNIGSELSGEKKSINHLTGHYTLAQINLGYTISENHIINLNHNYSRTYREGYNEIDPYNHSYDRSNSLNNNVTGLSYQQQFLNNRLSNNIFTKLFSMNSKIYDKDNIASNKSKQYLGYGAASSYKINKYIGIKASYEHAYRLPSLVELYGNRIEILGNPNLKPESSDNYNLGLYFTKTLGKGQFWAEASTYYRDANNFILSTPSAGGGLEGSYSQSYNAEGIIVNGFDGELRYDYNRTVMVMINLTYQNAVNRQRYASGTVREDSRYMSRIPNQPWLYGNFDLSIGKDDVLGKFTRLQFNWFTQFINDYSTDWSKLGNPQSNTYIPRQWIQNSTITYSTHSGRYNISLEGRNLTNMIAYDQFKLQKPGRSFFLKLRYAIQQN
jgi:outer membrane receptor protein involved in Fe transport